MSGKYYRNYTHPGRSRVDKYQNTRKWSLSIKWLKNGTGKGHKVYTAVCDCGLVCEVPQYRLSESCINKMTDCGCGIYKSKSGPGGAA